MLKRIFAWYVFPFIKMAKVLCTGSCQCFTAGLLSGPDSCKGAAEGWLTHVAAEEVGVPEE